MSFNSKFKEFIRDLSRSIPKYEDLGQIIIDALSSDNGDKYNSLLRQHFLDCIHSKKDLASKMSDEFFNTPEHTDLIKGLPIGPYWNEFSKDTKKAVWSYIVLLTALATKEIQEEHQSNTNDASGNDFGDFVSNISPEFVQDMLGKMKKHNEENPNANIDKNNLLDGLMDGKIGELAKEIGSSMDIKEFAESMGLKEGEELKNPMDILGKIGSEKGASKMMELMQTVGKKVASKMQSGELNPQDMMMDAMKMMGKIKNNPLMSSLSGMVNQHMKRNNMSERLRQKYEQQQAQAQQQTQQQDQQVDNKKKTRRGNRGGKKKKN